MKKLTLLLVAAVMISSGAYAQGCCKKNHKCTEKSACCKDNKNCDKNKTKETTTSSKTTVKTEAPKAKA